MEGESILVLVQPAEISYGPPGGEDIAVEVRGLHMGQEEGPSGMRAENMKVWLREATRDKGPDLEPRQWYKIVSVIKLEF